MKLTTIYLAIAIGMRAFAAAADDAPTTAKTPKEGSMTNSTLTTVMTTVRARHKISVSVGHQSAHPPICPSAHPLWEISSRNVALSRLNQPLTRVYQFHRNSDTLIAWRALRVRYMVNDLNPAVTFYTNYLGFRVKQQASPNFAMLSRGNLDLVLSTPFGPGGAARPMPDGRKLEPGGWNRIIIDVDDLAGEVARLRNSQLRFRNDIVKGPGDQKFYWMTHRETRLNSSSPAKERPASDPVPHIGLRKAWPAYG
jgi:catechol 2,3-dioxygenase-like lactoylglutathione lyase family enzyme